VDEKNSFIKFYCKNCGQRLKVSDTNAGKKGRCPKCKSIIVVPDIQTPEATNQQNDSENLKIDPNNSPYDATLLDMPEGGEIQKSTSGDIEVLKRESPEDEVEDSGGSKLPWLIDMFLYPISSSGLIHLAIFSFLPQKLLPLFSIGYWYSPPIFGLGFLVIYIGYFLFCISDYIYESANGNRRAPESKLTPNTFVHIEELLFPILNMFICIVACFGPLLVYSIIIKRIDFIFWLLVIYGNLFLPMVLLAVIMFDSFRMLNPIFIIGSIIKVFLRYCGLVLLFCSLSGLIALLAITLLKRQFVGYIFGIICIYIAMVTAHLLGRFYRRNKDKLGWGI
jgi:phage FluMu protein Com